MLRTFLRKISIFFSILSDFRTIKLNKKKHNIVAKFIKQKSIIFFQKNPRLNIHKNLSHLIMKIIKEEKLENFLRNSLIQNIFFIHNRLFILSELLELKKDKNWNLWKKLIIENDIGNPIRFFLYSKSSGNRIRQVYLVKKFLESENLNNFKKIKNVIEVGGGYGCMADIVTKLNKKITYTIYDMFEVNLLQYYYLKMNNHNPAIGKINKKINLISDIRNLNKLTKIKNDYFFIANWSISEFPLKFRYKFFKTIKNSKYALISFQSDFERINNLDFFKEIIKKLNKKFNYKIIPLEYYNNSILNKNKHFTLILIRK